MMFQHRPSLTPFALLLCGCALFYAVSEGSSWWWLAAYLAHAFLFSFGIGFGLHRVTAHHAFHPPDWIRKFAATAGVIAQGGSPMSWQTTHILHHSQSDRLDDPHSPGKFGWRVIFGYAEPVAKDFIIERALKEPGLRDPYLLFLHKYYYVMTSGYALTVTALWGLKGLVYLAAIPIGLSMLSLGLLNYFAHRKSEARNVWWLFPLTFGENWHGNHHVRPGARYSGRTLYEFDPIGFVGESLAGLFAKQDIPKTRLP